MPNKFNLSEWQEEREDALLMEPKPTACKDCRHFKDAGSMTWEKLCLAAPVPQMFNPIKGDFSDSGMFLSVYGLNFGHCPTYQEKEN